MLYIVVQETITLEQSVIVSDVSENMWHIIHCGARNNHIGAECHCLQLSENMWHIIHCGARNNHTGAECHCLQCVWKHVTSDTLWCKKQSHWSRESLSSMCLKTSDIWFILVQEIITKEQRVVCLQCACKYLTCYSDWLTSDALH